MRPEIAFAIGVFMGIGFTVIITASILMERWKGDEDEDLRD